jgi:hypothetical protein
MRRASLTLLGVALLLGAARAAAEAPDDTRAHADALFREGQELMTAGRTAEACEKLAESQRLDPKVGRLLNVAYCHEQQGRVAAAWSEYNEASAMAQQAGQAERVAFAKERAGKMAAQLTFLRLDLSAAPEVSEVELDQKPMAREAWTTPFPIDPGPHTLLFAAKGFKTRTESVTASTPGTVRIAVAALDREPQPVEPAAKAPAPVESTSPPSAIARDTGSQSSTTVGWALGGVGVLALGVGGAFALHAKSLRDQADPMCPNKSCTPDGEALIDDARGSATAATIAIAAGAVAIGVGVFLLVRSLSSRVARADAGRLVVKFAPPLGGRF